MDAPRTPLCCPRCGRVIAETDGPRLYVGGCFMIKVVTICCQQCGGRVVWQPYEAISAHRSASVLARNR